ncbi:hypothetical protein pb186bvf_017029 [Paramecium bursaria]
MITLKWYRKFVQIIKLMKQFANNHKTDRNLFDKYLSHVSGFRLIAQQYPISFTPEKFILNQIDFLIINTHCESQSPYFSYLSCLYICFQLYVVLIISQFLYQAIYQQSILKVLFNIMNKAYHMAPWLLCLLEGH